MQPTKLDMKRTYGHVFGHNQASFEQDGKLFDGGGFELLTEEKPLPAKKAQPKPEVEKQPTELMSKEQAFLLNMLTNNAMQKANIVKESTLMELSWDDVQEAASKLGVVSYMQGKREMWKLTDDSEGAE